MTQPRYNPKEGAVVGLPWNCRKSENCVRGAGLLSGAHRYALSSPSGTGNERLTVDRKERIGMKAYSMERQMKGVPKALRRADQKSHRAQVSSSSQSTNLPQTMEPGQIKDTPATSLNFTHCL